MIYFNLIFRNKLKKILVFILILVIFDQVVGYMLRELYFRQKTGQKYSLTYSFSQCKADLLIFGNSRAQHHYDTRIFRDSLKISCFNAGQDGGHSILLQYAQIKVITERYSPKTIILEFLPDSIVHYAGDYDKLSILLPYYKKYPEIRSLILLRSPYEKVKLLSAIYPFNSNVINILKFNTNTNAARKQDFDGYVPLKGVINIDMMKPKPESAMQAVSVVDIHMVNALKNIIRICKDKNISLFIVSSPIFHTVKDKQSPQSSAAKLFLDIIRNKKVNYLDFTFDLTFAGHLDLFKDRGHLNEKGAAIFTRLLIQKINIGNKLEYMQ